ncbi:MAG: hypothetical protein M1829_006041 [Trizodia sp. TS-e1964]|nr:MAG: hypothetical protein M1829_006041 [Trizodia sp. TS-e1964]
MIAPTLSLFASAALFAGLASCVVTNVYVDPAANPYFGRYDQPFDTVILPNTILTLASKNPSLPEKTDLTLFGILGSMDASNCYATINCKLFMRVPIGKYPQIKIGADGVVRDDKDNSLDASCKGENDGVHDSFIGQKVRNPQYQGPSDSCPAPDGMTEATLPDYLKPGHKYYSESNPWQGVPITDRGFLNQRPRPSQTNVLPGNSGASNGVVPVSQAPGGNVPLAGQPPMNAPTQPGLPRTPAPNSPVGMLPPQNSYENPSAQPVSSLPDTKDPLADASVIPSVGDTFTSSGSENSELVTPPAA